MADLLTTKPAEQTLKDYLVGLTPEQKAEVKAQAWSACDVPKNVRTDIGDFEVEIKSITSEKNCVSVLARAWDKKTGKQIGFGKDGTVDIERFMFYNPPILVPDGTTRQVYDEKIGENVKIDNFEEDVVEALKKSLDHTIRIAGKVPASENIVEGKVGSTVSTFYPVAGAVSPCDGYSALTTADQTWAQKHDGATGTDSSATSVPTYLLYMAMSTVTNRYNVLRRSIFNYDVSGIASGNLVSTAVMSFYVRAGVNSSGNSPTAALVSAAPAGTANVVDGDYDCFGTALWSDEKSFAAWDADTGSYTDLTLTAAAKAALEAKFGVGVFSSGLRESAYDVADSEPSWTSAGAWGFGGYWADQTGTVNDPKLVVTHEPAASDTSGFLLMF